MVVVDIQITFWFFTTYGAEAGLAPLLLSILGLGQAIKPLEIPPTRTGGVWPVRARMVSVPRSPAGSTVEVGRGLVIGPTLLANLVDLRSCLLTFCLTTRLAVVPVGGRQRRATYQAGVPLNITHVPLYHGTRASRPAAPSLEGCYGYAASRPGFGQASVRRRRKRLRPGYPLGPSSGRGRQRTRQCRSASWRFRA